MLSLKGGEKNPKPQTKTSDLSLLELMGDSHPAPAGNSSDFFRQLSMPCTSFGNFGGWTPSARLEEGGGTPARLVPGRLPAAGLTPGMGAGLGAGCPCLGQRHPALPIG